LLTPLAQVLGLHDQIVQYPEDFPHLIDVIFALVNRPLSILQLQEFPGAPRSDDPSNARALCLFGRIKPLRRVYLSSALCETLGGIVGGAPAFFGIAPAVGAVVPGEAREPSTGR